MTIVRTTFIVRTRFVLPLAVAGFCLLGSSPAWPAAAADENQPRIDVLAVQAQPDRMSLIADLHPAPVRTLEPAAVTATSGSIDLAIRSEPVLSDRTAVGVVMDASAAGADALENGGRAGATSFVQELPAQARSAVIADRRPAEVAAPSSVGTADGVQALSNLRSSGRHDTAAALTLALQQLPAWPKAQPVLVLYTGAPDAGTETAADLTVRLRQAHAILAVVSTNPDQQYWDGVAASTGGLVVSARGPKSVTAFDTLAEALRGRYEVTFDPLPDPTVPVKLQVANGDQTLVTMLTIPRVDTAERLHTVAAPQLAPHNGPKLWLVAAAVLLLFAVLAVVIGIFRPGAARPEAPPPPPAEPEPPEQPPALWPAGPWIPNALDDDGTPLPGVRVFDVDDAQAPRDVPDSLFEPHGDRDARTVEGLDEPAPHYGYGATDQW